MWFILFLISFFLVALFTPIGMIFTIIKSFLFLDYDYANLYFKKLAISLDQLGNVSMATIFNIIFITSDKHLFGNPDETISSVLGKNKLNNTLSYLGKRLDALLNGLDENHSINSIEK